MEHVDRIEVPCRGRMRELTFLVGDLSRLPQAEAVDVLVVSAFPNDYTPTKTSVIGALDRIGVHVRELAANKEVDLRQFSSCWLSRELKDPRVNYRRILCFEPRYRGRAPEVVGDIFRSIVPFTTGSPGISSLAVPLVASGDQGEDRAEMLEALAEAAVNWLTNGLPLQCIKIICHADAMSQALHDAFSRVKHRWATSKCDTGSEPCKYDLFISYCQKDSAAVDRLVEAIRDVRPSLRIFIDRLQLNPGAAWQQHVFEALDESNRIVCVLSPHYLASPICKEEFNIALLRHRESNRSVLLPLYMFTANLPSYMRLIQYHDAREGDDQKIMNAARLLCQGSQQ